MSASSYAFPLASPTNSPSSSKLEDDEDEDNNVVMCLIGFLFFLSYPPPVVLDMLVAQFLLSCIYVLLSDTLDEDASLIAMPCLYPSSFASS